MRNDDSTHDEHHGPGEDRESSLVHDLLWEYVEQLNCGKPIDEAQLRAKHPDIAAELLRQLATFQEIGDEEPSEGLQPLGTLGDYTLRRQIGRGGMGVVYEAWENSMDRKVALKVLP